MTTAFDQRIVRVGLEIDGEITVLEGLDIRASGRKFANPSCSQCTVRIFNLTKDQRNYILTKASPIVFREGGRQSINMYLDVGRKSTGVFRLFQGGVMATSASQPPDIGITLESLTNNYATSLIAMNSLGAITDLRTIAQTIASQNGLTLEFKATNRNIENYSFTGSVAKQVEKLQQAGNLNCFVEDDKTLVVLDANQLRTPSNIVINQNTGMVDVPQACDAGVIVRTLINPGIVLGCGIEVESVINPAVNGKYKALQINFDVASRQEPFWYTILGSNRPQDQGITQ